MIYGHEILRPLCEDDLYEREEVQVLAGHTVCPDYSVCLTSDDLHIRMMVEERDEID